VSQRIATRFERLRASGRAAFIPYIMAGDPDLEETLARMLGLVEAGADLIELGFPFTDPSADGPVIEEAGLRSLQNGTTLRKVIDLVLAFRRSNADTPVILMGYANPVHALGYTTFSRLLREAGGDGALIVDMPPEEDGPLRGALDAEGLSLIRLATPTTDAHRLKTVLEGASGFVYYVAQKGVTGSKGNSDPIPGIASVQARTSLPVVVGFGISTPEQVSELAEHSEGIVVGSALVEAFHEGGTRHGLDLARRLAGAIGHREGSLT
jgi:tryptophan synthase alpha chain